MRGKSQNSNLLSILPYYRTLTPESNVLIILAGFEIRKFETVNFSTALKGSRPSIDGLNNQFKGRKSILMPKIGRNLNLRPSIFRLP